MRSNKKILIVTIFLFIFSIYEPIIVSESYNNISNISISLDEKLWAVIITVGEPERDNKNAGELYNILLTNGWDKNNILYIKESQATKDVILSSPNWLEANGADQDDFVLFYFSMHGGRKNDTLPFDEPDNLDEFIVSYKQDDENNHILDDELSLMFDQIQSEKLVIVFETCYSGGMIDGTNDLRRTGRIVITSTKEDESSYPIFLIKSWLFPYYFLKGLKGGADKNYDNIITVEEAFEYAKIYTVKRSTIYGYLFFIFHGSLFIQHPQIYDGWPSEENNEEELKFISSAEL